MAKGKINSKMVVNVNKPKQAVFHFDANQFLYDAANELNALCKAKEIHRFYSNVVEYIDNDIHNNVVLLLTMCVNRELYLSLNDRAIEDVDLPVHVNKLCENIISHYDVINKRLVSKLKITDSEEFLMYLGKYVRSLLVGVDYVNEKRKYHTKYEQLENGANGKYRREERVRDSMKILIMPDIELGKYTIEHGIKAPYMYVLAWDLVAAFRHYDYKIEFEKEKELYVANVKHNSSVMVSYLSQDLLDILIDPNVVKDNEKEIVFDKKANEKSGLRCVVGRPKSVNFTYLLPSISCLRNENKMSEFDLLRKIPLLPYEEKDMKPVMKQAMKITIKALQAENEVKQFALDAQIEELSKKLNAMCGFLLELLKGRSDYDDILNLKMLSGKEKKDVVEYLERVKSEVDDLPRTNTLQSNQNYIERVAERVIEFWSDAFKNYHIPDVKKNMRDKDVEQYLDWAYSSVLRLSRNWKSHLLIKGYDITFLAFIFLISLRRLVKFPKSDLEPRKTKKYRELSREYGTLEMKLINMLADREVSYEKVNEEILKAKYVLLHKNVLKKSIGTSVTYNKSFPNWCYHYPRVNEKVCGYQVIATAGNEDSQTNKSVTFSEIYLVFWLTAHFGEGKAYCDLSKETMDENLIAILEMVYQYQDSSMFLQE